MPKPLSFGHLGVELTASMGPVGGVPQPETPLRIAILGDFSARANRPASAPVPRIADRSPVLVDRDNLDQVLKKHTVELHLPVAGDGSARMPIRFSELDDFHPDRLFQRVGVFQALRELRSKLSNAATFAAAAAEMRGWVPASTSTDPARPAPQQAAPAPPPVNSGDLLDQILGGTQSRPQASTKPSGSGDWQALIQMIVEPYLLPKTDYARQAELVALVDEVTGGHMRALLHHADYQAVEAAWRGVYFLVRRLDTDASLKLYLLDISKAELAADLRSSDDLRSTGVYRFLVEQTVGTPGGQPWGILAGQYTFGQSREDAELLGRMAQIARRAGAPFLAAADPGLLGCESLAATPDPDDWRRPVEPSDAEAWQALRQLKEASYLGLALPRFLLRLPYGKATNPAEQFDFEEMPEGSRHENYLWGHPAITCACLMAQAFSRYGWSFRPGAFQELDGLPVHAYREDGESRVKPCAEVELTERAIEAILGKGLMPLLSVRGRDVVRVGRFHSLAEPTTPLAGRWAEA